MRRAALLVCAAVLACGEPPAPQGGQVAPGSRAAEVVAARRAPPAGGKQILFGDLHVHTTFSFDAFLYSLPVLGGEGAHPPADACDYARWCAGLDFFSINDHAEALTAAHWKETKRAIRECNERAGDPAAPDLVAFLGWEWTQIGSEPANHYGHKNVIFPGLAEGEVPARPISSTVAERASSPPAFLFRAAAGVAHVVASEPYAALVDLMGQVASTPPCDPQADVRALPPDCLESVSTPGELFRKLDQWGFPSLVIPHGTAWGAHVPQSFDLATQLTRAQHDAAKQKLIEVMSGHGNSEEFRASADLLGDAPPGTLVRAEDLACPAPTADFLPCCWRAGELARAACGDIAPAECEQRVEDAKRLALLAGTEAHRVIPGASAEDWLDCDQCRDCFEPALGLRPRMTAQYGAALSNFAEPDEAGRPQRFRLGFIASSDIHNARAGAGFKQSQRRRVTDQHGPPTPEVEARVRRFALSTDGEPGVPTPVTSSRLRELFDTERGASFLYTGGIVAVHAIARDRMSIWNALDAREVYGTSGPRMLLWFDLLAADGTRHPMGSELMLDAAPRFEVRAVGAQKQLPGCPADAKAALSPERLRSLCLDECFHPGDERHAIAAIEVVRIRPQREAGEPIAPLIEDPWRRFDCAPSPDGCTVTFDDPEFATAARDAVYYVRALQEATPAINGAQMRTRFDAEGNAVAVEPCYGSYRTPESDDCLAPVHERAWSSPIYVDWVGE